MQNILAGIMEFVIREARALIAIVVFVCFIYIWGKLSEKEQYYRWFVKINPKNAEAHDSLGRFLKELPDRKAEAENEFRQAIALRPNYSWSYYALYYLQAEQRKILEAEKTLEQMLRTFPDDGVTFACQGNY